MAAPVRVLVVDDDVDFRALLRWQLDNEPVCDIVGDVADGFEALEQVAALAPEVAVVDLMMPGMDGFELIDRLRADHPDVRPVAYSAMANDRARDQLHAIGVQMLTKSGDPRKLLDVMVQLAAEARDEVGAGQPDSAAT